MFATFSPQGIVDLASVIALTFCRIGGFVMLSPFPGAWLPKRAKVALVIALAVAVGSGLPAPTQHLQFDLSLVPLVFSDCMVGLMIGAAFRFVVAAAEFMAGMVSQASWLSAPVSMNPDLGGQSQVLSQVSTLLALLVALGAGVHRVVIAYLLETFSILPPGTPAQIHDGLLPFIDLVGTSFDIGMRLAMPVLAVSLAVQTALALISRVAPTLQIFSIGFAVLVATGLITFMASMQAISLGILNYTSALPTFLEELFLRLTGS